MRHTNLTNQVQSGMKNMNKDLTNKIEDINHEIKAQKKEKMSKQSSIINRKIDTKVHNLKEAIHHQNST